MKEQSPHLSSYVMDHDTGFAPNPFFGTCILSHCKYSKSGKKNVIESADVGDWVVGTGGKKNTGHGTIIYAMRVKEKLPIKRFYSEKRFAKQRRLFDYGSTCCSKGKHHGDFFLVSREFHYFGREAQRIPKSFKFVEKKGPGFKRNCFSPAFIQRFVKWIGALPKGQLGSPYSEHPQVKFIRVGVDSGCGQRHSRLFRGGYYHFIPIPKHNDPEFCRFTYGQPATPPKGNSLLKLRRGDYLVFYASFAKDGAQRDDRILAIFGFLRVEKIFLFGKVGKKLRAVEIADEPRNYEARNRFRKDSRTKTFNALCKDYHGWSEHVEEDPGDELQIVVCGDLKKSRLLKRVALLAKRDSKTGNFYPSAKTASTYGLNEKHDFTMSVIRNVSPEDARKVATNLEHLA